MDSWLKSSPEIRPNQQILVTKLSRKDKKETKATNRRIKSELILGLEPLMSQ